MKIGAALLLYLVPVAALCAAAAPDLDTARIDELTGLKGNFNDD